MCTIFFASCKKNETSAPAPAPATTYSIGQNFQGGIIAYVFQYGDQGYIAGETHGLIASPSDQSTGIQWYNGTYITTGTYQNAIGTGNSNTDTIVNIQGAGVYAAKLCYDLVLGGYNDWYLPSYYELKKLYLNKTAIGGFAVSAYWSSSEDYYASPNINTAVGLNFDTGYQTFDHKNLTRYVRAVRNF